MIIIEKTGILPAVKIDAKLNTVYTPRIIDRVIKQGKNMIHRLFFAMMFAAASSMAIAGGADGVWSTEVAKDGGYLQVKLGPCDSDSSKTCGKISKAFNKQGVDPNYENLGKLMVKDMESHDGTSYSGGTIWDPEKNKTYKSKMHLKGDTLDVEGCVSIFCSGQDWKRVK